jgi:hypothetical protein
MAYFNHAFRKTFLGTGTSLTGDTVTLPDSSTVDVSSDSGYVYLQINGTLPTYGLNTISKTYGGTYETGYFGFFSPSTNTLFSISDQEVLNCCPLYIAGSAIYTNDKIGPFHGGYQETNKSKVINPRYVSRFYYSAPCTPSNEVLHVGSTYWTAGGGVLTVSVPLPAGTGTGYAIGDIITVSTTSGNGTGIVVQVLSISAGAITAVTIINPGKGYAATDTINLGGGVGGDDAVLTVTSVTETGAVDPITGSGGASCCKEFLCGETYYLRLDIKGSPALRYLNHNAYYTAEAYTGCCPDNPDDPQIAPVPVDSTEVFIKWAQALTNSPIVNPFMQIIVQDQEGVLWYEPGTSAADLAALGGMTWDMYNDGVNHTSPGYIEGACAGLIINGAYVDTKFGDCTFQISDFYEKEPVKLYASETDLNGDPCAFTGICVVHECLATQANGLGETVLRDLILSESYRQNFFHSDFRIREITQGNQIVSAIDRNALYWNYYLQHNVPRHNNPTGTFDADQYLLQFVSANQMTIFEQDVQTWLENCGVCEFGAYECETSCEPPIQFPPLPIVRGKFPRFQ